MWFVTQHAPPGGLPVALCMHLCSASHQGTTCGGSSDTATSHCLPVGDTGDGHHNPGTQPTPYAQAEAATLTMTVPKPGPCECQEKPTDNLKHMAQGFAAGPEGLLQQPETICTETQPASLLHHHLHTAEALLLPEQLQTVNTCSPMPSCHSPTTSTLVSMLGDTTSPLHMHHVNACS